MTTEPGPPDAADADAAPDAASDAPDLAEENERLRAELAAATSTKVSRRRVRRTIAAVLAGLTAVLLVLSVVATWTSRTALDTDKFVDRVGPVVQDPTVRAAVATELGDELVKVLDLQNRITPVLPDNLRFIAGPLSSGANNYVRQAVTKFVDSDAFVQLWYTALRVAHTQVVHALTGSSKSVQVVNGKIVINLIAVIGQVVDQLQSDLPALIGTAVAQHIPDNLPLDQIRNLVQNVLGVQLPADFGMIPVMDASTLEAAKTGVKVVNLSVILVLLLSLAAFVLALVVSVDRRRTLVQIGLATAVLTVIVFFVARTFTDQAVNGVGDSTLRPAVTAAVRELFSSLRGWAWLLLWSSLVLAAVAYLVGPGRGARAIRGWAVGAGRWTSRQARTVRENEGWATWTARYLDPLRIGGAVVALVLLIWLSSWVALFVIGALLVLYEVGVTLYARSTPASAAEVDAETGVTEDVGTPT
jgi:hypothetical protein